MLFYEAKAEFKNGEWLEHNYELKDMRQSRTNAEKLGFSFEKYNEKVKNALYIFIADIDEKNIDFGICVNSKEDIKEIANSAIEFLGIESDEVSVEEITFSRFSTMLKHADRENFVNDDDEILKKLDLSKMDRYSNYMFGERLVENRSRKELEKVAEKYLMKNDIFAEMERIYLSKKDKFYGHPVHYIVQTDDHDTRLDIYKLLIETLANNNRIYSRRYCFIDVSPDDNFNEENIEAVYKSSKHGTVVVRFINDEAPEVGEATYDVGFVVRTCEIMKRYKNEVLTIFCLPRECTNIKNDIYKEIGYTSLVEIKEDYVYDDAAKDALKSLAKEYGVRCNKDLIGKIQEGHGYLMNDLRDIFDEWYDIKLKKDVFSEYKEFENAKKKILESEPKGSAYDRLQKMVGLKSVKEIIEKALNYYKAQKLFKDKGMTSDQPAMHMIFTGNPGSAKTTVARLFAEIMRDNNVLSKGHLVEVGRADLVGKYVGWTAKQVKAAFRKAEGGVLFIDEAYSLVDDRNGSFGDEAINTIVQEMENHREDMVVIFAGYPDKMDGFIKKNPGLNSRIAFHVPFADYNAEELCDIADLIAKDKGVEVTKEAREKLLEIFQNATCKNDFGNGRFVRNVIENSKMNLAQRLVSMNFDDVTVDDIKKLRPEDISSPDLTQISVKKSIGFCA